MTLLFFKALESRTAMALLTIICGVLTCFIYLEGPAQFSHLPNPVRAWWGINVLSAGTTIGALVACIGLISHKRDERKQKQKRMCRLA